MPLNATQAAGDAVARDGEASCTGEESNLPLAVTVTESEPDPASTSLTEIRLSRGWKRQCVSSVADRPAGTRENGSVVDRIHLTANAGAAVVRAAVGGAVVVQANSTVCTRWHWRR